MQGETVLITGGAKRLGRATALALAKNGFNIVVHYNESRAEAEFLLDELRTLGVSAWAIQAALSDAGSCTALLEACREAVGDVHHLVNNASIFPADTLDEITTASLESSLSINTMVPFVLSIGLKDAGSLRSVTHFLDTRIVDYDANHVSYHLSKRALMSLTSIMALEWAPEVRVNAVAPGLILPPEGEAEDYLEKLAHTNPLQAVGDTGDISDTILFLINSKFVTGQIIYVDGGRHLKGRVYE
jgi:NAD(P)-dependent dehydrogenase (short-subunit alcohol dehydrogenase family)